MTLWVSRDDESGRQSLARGEPFALGVVQAASAALVAKPCQGLVRANPTSKIPKQCHSFLGAKVSLMMAISDLFLRKLKKSPGLPEAGQHFKVHKAVMQVETTSYEEICCLE